MDFISAVKICFKKYGDFNGRASRSEFWYFYLFGIIVGILSYYIAIQTYTFAIIYITGLPLLIPHLAVSARRLHDTNKSGWLQVFAYIPIVNWVGAIVLIVFYCTAGKNKKNKYGQPIKFRK